MGEILNVHMCASMERSAERVGIKEPKQILQVSKSALNHCDKENARTWKSICLLVTRPVICLFQNYLLINYYY